MSGFVYVAQDKATQKYRGNYDTWVDNFNEARLYSRTCDVKNSLRHYKSGEIDIIKCDVVPHELPKYRRVICKLGLVIRTDGTHWESRVFDKIDKATQYLIQSSKECNLHADYFNVVPATKEEFDKQEPIKYRPDWPDYFLGIALLVSKRSHDIHTQHGCVIVDNNTHHILATGYNGFPREMNDDKLPTTRPEKYDWMIHSEVNACNNLWVPTDENTVAYVTGECCTPCLIHMWQRGITKVVERKALGSKFLIDEKSRKNKEILLAQTGMKVYSVEPNLSWLAGVCLSQ
jgi:dCMP deaminase